MKNNTFNHISDGAENVAFANANFPGVANVKEALDLVKPTIDATELVKGVAMIATNEEAMLGVDDTKFITPKKMKFRFERPAATETLAGVARLATSTEAVAVTDDSIIITPLKLGAVFDHTFKNRKATELKNGVIKIATTAAATAGVDDTTAITPLKLKQALNTLSNEITTYTEATEKSVGVVRLATVGQVTAGVLREGYAISPYTLQNLTGNTTRRGIVQAATSTQVAAGTDDSLYISAKGFKTFLATATVPGTVLLSDEPGVNGVGIALSAKAKVLKLDGGQQTVTSSVNFSGSLKKNGVEISPPDDVMLYMPTPWPNTIIPDTHLVLMGQTITQAQYPNLFKYYGPVLPDMRAMTIRGLDHGRGIDSNRAVLSYQEDDIKSHNHDVVLTGFCNGRDSGWHRDARWSSGDVYYNRTLTNSNSIIAPAGGTETRVKNISFLYIVRKG